MSVQQGISYQLVHLNQLPKPVVRWLAFAVFMVHCLIFCAVALNNSVATVAIDAAGGGGGGGGGSGTGNGVMRVSVLQVPQGEIAPEPAQVSEGQENLVSSESDDADGDFFSSSSSSIRESASVSNTATNQGQSSSGSGTGTGGGVGTGTGTGTGSGIGSGSGSGIGSGVGSGVGSGTGSGTGAGNGGGIVSVSASALRYRNPVRPVYPETSIDRRETGQVNVRVVVGTDGSVRSVALERSSGFRRLDDAAMTAARRSSFYPYVQNGSAVSVMAVIPYRFNLNG